MAEQPVRTWRLTMRGRLTVIAAVAALWSGAIQARLVHLQIFKHAELTALAERQQSRRRELPAKRGEILDRHGRVPRAERRRADHLGRSFEGGQ